MPPIFSGTDANSVLCDTQVVAKQDATPKLINQGAVYGEKLFKGFSFQKSKKNSSGKVSEPTGPRDSSTPQLSDISSDSTPKSYVPELETKPQPIPVPAPAKRSSFSFRKKSAPCASNLSNNLAQARRPSSSAGRSLPIQQKQPVLAMPNSPHLEVPGKGDSPIRDFDSAPLSPSISISSVHTTGSIVMPSTYNKTVEKDKSHEFHIGLPHIFHRHHEHGSLSRTSSRNSSRSGSRSGSRNASPSLGPAEKSTTDRRSHQASDKVRQNHPNVSVDPAAVSESIDALTLGSNDDAMLSPTAASVNPNILKLKGALHESAEHEDSPVDDETRRNSSGLANSISGFFGISRSRTRSQTNSASGARSRSSSNARSEPDSHINGTGHCSSPLDSNWSEGHFIRLEEGEFNHMHRLKPVRKMSLDQINSQPMGPSSMSFFGFKKAQPSPGALAGDAAHVEESVSILGPDVPKKVKNGLGELANDTNNIEKIKKLYEMVERGERPPVGTKSTLGNNYGKVMGFMGKGTYGLVRYSVKLSPPDEKHPKGVETRYAIKELKKRQNESNAHYAKRLTSEFCIGSSLHHRNIISTLDLTSDYLSPTFNNDCYYEVMECCLGGDLYSLVKAEGGLQEDEADCFFKQILSGLAYMHEEHGVAHCDLKPENILLTVDGCVKIIDFGNAEVVKTPWDTKYHFISGVGGSAPYIAPEEYIADVYDPRAADIWACGVMYMSMVLGNYLWSTSKYGEDKIFDQYVDTRGGYAVLETAKKNIAAMIERNGEIITEEPVPGAKKPRRPPFEPIETIRSPKRRLVVYCCLELDPTKRYTAKRLLETDWIKNNVKLCKAALEG